MNSKDSDGNIERRVGDYVLLRRLGRGGMGKVYLARDVTLDRFVALKVLNATFANDPDLVRRFRTEAKAAAQLDHPHIVRVYAVREEKKVPYISMEYIEGQTLEQLLATSGPLPWQRALEVARQVAEALACAHAHGIIHRDIKPGNVLLDANGQVHVADFGLAKFLDATSGITSGSDILGTPQYMSPEHCGSGKISTASDVFSLGVMLYEMLSGRRPFTGDTPMMLVRQIALESEPPLRSVTHNLPRSVCYLVANLMEKEPHLRLPSGPALVSAITDTLELKHVDFPKKSRVRFAVLRRHSKRFFSVCKRHQNRIVLAALILVASALVLSHLGQTRRELTHWGQVIADLFTNRHASPGFKTISTTQVSAQVPDLNVVLRPIDWTGSSLIAFGLESRQDYGTEKIVLAAFSPKHKEMQTFASFASVPGWKRLHRASPEFTIPHVPDSSPLSEGVLAVLPARDIATNAYFQEVVLAKMGKNNVERSVLFRADPLGSFAGNPAFYAGGCFGAVTRPDGSYIALILSKGTLYREMSIAELSTDAASGGQLSDPIIDGSPPILGATYAPDSSSLAYVRVSRPSVENMREGAARRLRDAAGSAETQEVLPPLRELLARQTDSRIPTELWLLPLAAPENKRQLATGESADFDFAFSPDGKTLLAARPTAGDDTPELLLFTLDTSSAPVSLGNGWIGRSPWHPTGRYFLVSSRDFGNKTRVEAVFPNKDTHQILVEGIAPPPPGDKLEGEFPSPCVSTDGRWAAIQSSEENTPSLLFLNLARLIPQ